MTKAELDASIEKIINSDTAFQSELESLSDEEKTQKITKRKDAEFEKEFTALKEKAEKLSKAEELGQNQKIRAEKAEAELKKGKVDENALSTKDTLALIENKVSTEDFDEVVRVSKIIGKSIGESLKDKTLKSILSERMEERQTALATKTGGGARGTSSVTPEAMLAEAARGQLPEDDDGIGKLAEAWIQAKKKK